MNFKERRFKAEQIMCSIDDICFLDNAYCEMEEDDLKEKLRAITGAASPSLWEWSLNRGRSVAYAAMFSKLLLTYLLSEIKSGNLLNTKVLDEIKDMEIEPYTEFLYVDCGYKTAEALKTITQKIIRQEGYFEIETFPIFLPELEDEDEEFISQKICEAFISDCPEIKEYAKQDDFSILSFWKDVSNYEVEIEKISSVILNQIKAREKENPTKEGTEIIGESSLFEKILHQDLITTGISYQADLGEKTAFYAASASSIFGDDIYLNTFSLDRHHRYCYSDIFKIDSLIKKITEYKRRYLES